MKRWIIRFTFLAIGVVNSALMAHLTALNFETALLYPSIADRYHTAGYIAIVFSLLFLGAGVVLAIKGTDNMVGMDDDDQFQHELDTYIESHMES